MKHSTARDSSPATASQAPRSFFDLPLEEKLAIRQRKEQKGSRGYEPVGTEQLSATIGLETPPDLKESISVGPLEMPDHPSCRTEAAAPLYRPNMWPENPATLRPTCEAYIRDLDRLSQHLHRLAAIAFDLPEDYFEDKIDRGFSLLRVLNYPDQREDPEEGSAPRRRAFGLRQPHHLLIEDKPGGLQARGPDGSWVDVPVVAGSFVVNIGDFLMRWTNDRWKSTRHRVVNPPRAAGERLSACHFIMPNHDAVIECLPTCQTPEHPAKYSPIVAGDYMIENLPARRAVRSGATKTAANSAPQIRNRASPTDRPRPRLQRSADGRCFAGDVRARRLPRGEVLSDAR